MFEEDITAPNSPIWDVDFKKSLPSHLYSGFDKREFDFLPTLFGRLSAEDLLDFSRRYL